MGEKILFIYISCNLLMHSWFCNLIYILYCLIKYKTIYMCILTSISHTVTVSVYTSQWTNSAKHSRRVQQLITINYDETPSPTSCHLLHFFRCPTSFQYRTAVCVLLLPFGSFNLVCWRCLRIRRILYWWGWGRLILSFWQNDKKNLWTLNMN